MTKREYATPFSILHAASLLSHRQRISKFSLAIEKSVRQEDYVIDIGTGSGILAILAAKRGATVTAIDINEESLRYAEKASKMNGVEDRIKFIHSHFLDYKNDQRADIVICEMLSSVMLIEQQIPAASYAVRHLLKPSGKIIPEEVRVFFVPVQGETLWNRFVIEGLEFPRVPQTTDKSQCRDLADPIETAHFDLTVPNNDAKVDRTLSFKVVEDGIIHGLVGMFESRLCEGITLQMEDGWRDLFIPFTEPLSVKEGETIRVRVSYSPGEFDSLEIEVK